MADDEVPVSQSQFQTTTSNLPPEESLDFQMLTQLRTTFSRALKEFAASNASFRVLRSIPPSESSSSSASPSYADTLFVLDSSFNPPSKAHFHIVASAISSHQEGNKLSDPTTAARSRVLLLLATQNADKKPKPADFEDRLVMMTLMAGELRRAWSRDSGEEVQQVSSPQIDIAVTKNPFFIDKARAIGLSGVYSPESSPLASSEESDRSGKTDDGDKNNQGDVPEQVHLIGFDTLTRIFDKKYYGEKGLDVLEPFLERNRLRVLVRDDDDGSGGASWGGKDEQWRWIEAVKNGEKLQDGIRREWAGRIELVDGGPEGKGVSSTKARKAAKEGRWEELGGFVGVDVGQWIRERDLYRN